ncbi:MAG: glutamate--tRNA ligase [Candidatus Velthaea sp.]
MRFAPSPSGMLHAGAARTALFNWLLARRTGGRVVLRIDDAGGERHREGEAALYEDMRWLGLDHDEGPDRGGAYGPYRQSERLETYRARAAELLAARRAYEADGAVHFRVPPGRTALDDLVKGRVVYDNADIGDVVIVKSNGAPTYNFAAAIDDALMQIDLVLRVDEHLDNTPRQLLLQDALGLRSPQYAHVGSIVPDEDVKGSGAHATVTVAELRRLGYLPAALINHLALLGWAPGDEREEFTLDELVREFSLDRVGRSKSAFNEARLRAFNARELRKLARPALAAMLADAMQRTGLLESPAPEAAMRWIDTFLDAHGSEIDSMGEAIPLVAELRAEAITIPALELEKLRNRQVVFFLDAVSQYVDAQSELRGLPLAHDLPAIAEEFGIAKNDAFAAVRMALTGKHDGAPLTLVFPLLGHDRILMRIGAVSSHLLHGRGLEPIKYGPGGVPFETIQPAPPPR